MSGMSLEFGEIVKAEIREGAGAISTFSHDYPIDPSGLLRIPSLKPLQATGKELPQLRDAIADAMVDQGLFGSVIVNLTLLPERVDFNNKIISGDDLFLRILESDGVVAPSSGLYPVDPNGSINIPLLGSVLVKEHLLFEGEHAIEQGLIDGGFFIQPFVNVTRVRLS